MGTSRRSFLRILGIGAAVAPAAAIAAQSVPAPRMMVAWPDPTKGGMAVPIACGCDCYPCGCHSHTFATGSDSAHTHTISLPDRRGRAQFA